MENAEIARILAEVADLLEIQGANEFRVRAYRSATSTIGGLTRPLAEMVADDEDLTELPGVGADIAGYVKELVATGKLQHLEELRDEVPGSLADLLKLEGVGPKGVKKLWHELDVTSIDALESALEDGRVQDLKSFGDKTVEKLRRSIDAFRRHTGRVMISEADQLVEPLLEHLGHAPGIERLQVAGSYRRRKETVGDIDILAVCGEPTPVMEHFTHYEGVQRVAAAGTTLGTIVLRTGLHVDLRIVPRESYGAALVYFTGSKAHNVALRRRGMERGSKINEYGVFEVPEDHDAAEPGPTGGARVGGEDEAGVFEAVDLAWIPPELRENRGEIAAAARDQLPTLIELRDIRGDLQLHSTWSDGEASIRDMVEACRDRGYAYLAVTDHSRRSASGGMDERQVERQWEEIEAVRRDVEGIHVLRGMEVDILEDGSLDLDHEHLEQLDVVVVSVHSHMDLPKAAQTDRIVRAISHPAVHILAHPTGRQINVRGPFDVEVDEVLHAAKQHRVAVELNANPKRLDLNDIHVFRARDLGVPVVIDSDAHSTDNLSFMRYGVDQARRGWLEKADVLNTKTLRQLQRWLDQR